MSFFRKYSVLSIIAAGLAAFAIGACGSDDDSDKSGPFGSSESMSALAEYAPADAPVFVEAAVQPDDKLAGDIDSLSERIAGVKLSSLIEDELRDTADTDVDFEADIKPWLGEMAGIFVQFDASTFDQSDEFASEEEKVGGIVETTDPGKAQDFIDEQADKENWGAENEYEGFAYRIDPEDDEVVGMIDDKLAIASSEVEFKAMVDASKGDNLAGSDLYKELSSHVADGALATIFSSHDPYLEAIENEGTDLGGLTSALGMDFEGTGSVASLVPTEDEISIQSYTNLTSDLTSGDPSAVIESFPADAFAAFGLGDVGSNAKKIIDALNEEGIPNVLEPGQVQKAIDELASPVDIEGIVESLETVAVFAQGETEADLGGALVATSSDIDLIKESLPKLRSLIGVADDVRVEEVDGELSGFRIHSPDLRGRPIVVGTTDDRLVIAVGLKAARAAAGGDGETLADNAVYQAADASTADKGLNAFADPDKIADLIDSMSAGDPEAAQVADVIRKFSYLASGIGSSEGASEINLGVDK